MEALQVTLQRAMCYYATCLRVIDGDTVEANIELGLDVQVVKKCRIRDYDSPEMQQPTRTPALKAKDALAAILPPGTPFWIVCPSWSVDKYARVVGRWYTIGGELIRDLLPEEYRL